MEPTTAVNPGDILARLPAAFDAARKAGDLVFYDSTVRSVPGEFPFEIRTAPALGEKKAATEEAESPEGPETKRKRVDAPERPSPFRPPYVPGLYVGSVAGVEGEVDMSVLLNKFSLLPEHFLLCPVVEEPQSLPPTPGQLAQTFAFILAANRERRDLLAFYNGGPGAGASQRWRHLQFVEARAPIESWVRGMTFERPNYPVIHPNLPYLHIVCPLPPAHNLPSPMSADDLVELADRLAPLLMRSLDVAFDALRRAGGDRSQGWNLLMTLDHMHLIPRSAPSFVTEGLTLDINSLGYAGMLLVKSDAEGAALDRAAEKEGGLINILTRCAIPREFGEQAAEAEATLHLGSDEQLHGHEEANVNTDGRAAKPRM
ncbi:uncharacterized protein CcaverHIS019_0304510 [Cutaneotrichosporon cavernicola]|uniref:HIT-like protein n=1 Tax=Cutaneotrichosporon cavernicola TaxID=279322 RepID=A0AA48L0U7_9TREE|nr:uncharacterized protein CcaverHIS019_0304510 [Cutaneotrichosporon cavernicola]BEI90381.1 hypothetical protein CcaverHIS019_0304510 [Cutaneotrichosporon cavernicola]BEI98157.1 hypothetical protein CcaverHIS631_0304560 [Cutaneotrichosporon cavernicola]